jgi:hypothetical protein
MGNKKMTIRRSGQETRQEKLHRLTDHELGQLSDLLRYDHYDERALKLDVQRETQRRIL